MQQTNTFQNGKFVEANGLNIYYEEYGYGEPLILIHGGMGIGNNFEQHILFFPNNSGSSCLILGGMERRIIAVENSVTG